MDTEQLQKWLGLPPGLWPPEPHILLGVKAGADANAVQDRALAQMEKLRPYQLMNPELVTEGMNRLAQAIMAFEEAIKPATIPKPVSEPEFIFEPESSESLPAPPAFSGPVIVDAEVVEVQSLGENKVDSKPKPIRHRKRKRKTVESVPKVEPLTMSPPPGLALANRRKAYRQIAQVRRELRSWEHLGPFFGVPSRVPVMSSEVFQLLEALSEARKSLTDSHFRGSLVFSLVHQGVPVSTFRTLLKSQRQSLANDWATGFAELQGQRAALRQGLRSSKPTPTPIRRLKRVGTWLRRHPEWKLVLPLLLAGIIAAGRMMKMKVESSGH